MTVQHALGAIIRMHPRPEDRDAIRRHIAAWHRSAGRTLPGTRLHLALDGEHSGAMTVVHLFENAAAFRRAMASEAQAVWLQELGLLLGARPVVEEVAVGWNAATDARPRVSVSIDRDVHATVQDLIGRLLDRHPRTPAEDLYLSMLQSIAADYEAEHPAYLPEEGEPR